MRFAQRTFLVAGIYGTLGLLPQYFLEDRIGHDFAPPLPHPEHFYGFFGVALAWQIAFFIVARDPVRYRPMIVPCILEKVAYGGAIVILGAMGRSAPILIGTGVGDLVFAALFTVAYLRIPA